jgi:hypothetical protein
VANVAGERRGLRALAADVADRQRPLPAAGSNTSMKSPAADSAGDTAR